jgi:hypothetical protein
MKSRSTLFALSLTVVLAGFLVMLSCYTRPENTSQKQNQNQDQIQAAASPIVHDPACNETNIETKRQKTQDKIDQELKRDDELKDGRVKILVKVVDGTYLEALVEGRAGGDDELADLDRILRKFMKGKCVLRVSFVPAGTIPTAAATQVEGFEWERLRTSKGSLSKRRHVGYPLVLASRLPRAIPIRTRTQIPIRITEAVTIRTDAIFSCSQCLANDRTEEKS